MRTRQELAEEVEFHVGLEAMQREHAAHGELTARRGALCGAATVGERDLLSGRVASRLRLGVRRYRAAGRSLCAPVSFRRTPMFTAVAVLTLAVGIGANTAIFSAVDAVLLRPLPFREPERLMNVSLSLTGDAGAARATTVCPGRIRSSRCFVGADDLLRPDALDGQSQFTVRVGDDAVRDAGEFIDSHYLSTLGVPLALGRVFRRRKIGREGRASRSLSDDLWQMYSTPIPPCLAEEVDVDGFPTSIVGVAPAAFTACRGARLLDSDRQRRTPGWNVADAWNHNYFGVARLAPGVSLERAKAIVPELGARVDAAYPNLSAERRWEVITVHLGEAATQAASPRYDALECCDEAARCDARRWSRAQHVVRATRRGRAWCC